MCLTTESIFEKEAGAYDRFSKLVTLKGYHLNTVTQDAEILHTGGHSETDAQGHRHSRHKWRQTHKQPQYREDPWAARQELAGPCHSSLQSQAAPFQEQWVSPNSDEAFATICDHGAEVQGG